MDLHTVTALRRPATRAELGDLGPGVAVLAGGSWLFSEPQTDLHTLVDLTGLGWPALTVTDVGLVIGATCTLAELAGFTAPPDWPAGALLRQCCVALSGSFKIWNVATVGGNICLSLPAGPMISLAVALDGVALVWRPGGAVAAARDVVDSERSGPGQLERRVPVAEFVTGDRRNALRPGEVLRAVELPSRALAARTAFRRIALSRHGRSASLVIGRRDPDRAFTLTVTAATDRPYRFAFPEVPGPVALRDALDGVPGWYDDPHGAPDWRRAMTGLLAEEIRAELA